jgi:lipoprotein-releasing system ATP-binding protein
MINASQALSGALLSDVPASWSRPGPAAESGIAGEVIVGTSQLYKRYRRGPSEVEVLRGVDLAVRQGEFCAIVGHSGSGKSTLLHLLGTLDRPDQGEIWLQGRRIDQATSAERERLRNQTLGMVFQFYHLLPELTALENVVLAGMIRGGVWGYWQRRAALRRSACELLEEIGLGHRLHHRPRELSGGEMQRVAIARALVTEPTVLLADEPTGNLDRQAGTGIVQLLRKLNIQRRLTILMVTHDESLAQQTDRVCRLVEGRMADG